MRAQVSFRCHRVGPVSFLLTFLAIVWATSGTLQAVILYGSGDPTYNTSPPTGSITNSGWDLEGTWGAFLGTPIAPNLFVTAKHIGGQVGGIFTFRGVGYTVIDSFVDSQTDLHIFKVCGIFPAYAELYTSGNEVGKTMVVFGRGTQRGATVLGNTTTGGTESKGWKWGGGDGIKRWGTNVVSTTTSGGTGLGDMLVANFDATGGTDECTLSGGDSGGAVFINDGAGWKLAGLNYAVDGPFNTTNSGPGFFAAIFDKGGLYETNSITGTWDYTVPNPLIDSPSSFYATRISANLTWINSIIAAESQSSYVPALESTPDLNTKFTVNSDYTVDEALKTITLGIPARSLYLRLEGCTSYQINSTEIQGNNWILHYGP